MFSILFFALEESALRGIKAGNEEENREFFWLNLIALIFTLHYLGNILANNPGWCF